MYEPKPIETAQNPLPTSLEPLVERLAEHIHDIWAQRRIADGWTFGPQRDDANRKHPCLVPFDELPDAEKQYDRNTATQAVRAILALGGSVSFDLPMKRWACCKSRRMQSPWRNSPARYSTTACLCLHLTCSAARATSIPAMWC